MRVVKVLTYLTTYYGALLGAVTIAMVLNPLMSFRGALEGYVSLVNYDLRLFGEVVNSSALGATSLLSILVVVASTLNVVFNANLIYRALREKEKHVVGWYEARMAASLTMLTSLGVVRGIQLLIEKEVDYLASVFDHVTSAGRVILVKTEVITHLPYIYFFSNVYLFLVLSYVILSVANYIAVTYRSTYHPMEGSSGG